MAQSRRKLLMVIASVGALIIAVAVAIFFVRKNGQSVVNPRKGPVIEAVYGLGTVMAAHTFQAKTAVNQNLIDVFVQEGDRVEQGAPLVKFGESGILKAPFAGTVSTVPFRKGELVFPSIPVLTLLDLKNLFLEVSLEQQAVLRVLRDQRAVVSFESLRSEKFEGKVQSVFPRDSQFIVRINLEKFPESVLPGMTADVAIEIGRREDVLLIPIRAITGGKVTVRRDSKSVKEEVSIGVVDGSWAEVTSKNISVDDEIVVRNR